MLLITFPRESKVHMVIAVLLDSWLTVTVTGDDWLGANVASPEYCATTESVPPGSRFVEKVTVPLLSAKGGPS